MFVFGGEGQCIGGVSVTRTLSLYARESTEPGMYMYGIVFQPDLNGGKLHESLSPSMPIHSFSGFFSSNQ